MSYDPQNDPLDHPPVVIKRLIDIDGVEIVVWRDQDGDEWVTRADEFDGEEWL